MDPLRRKVKKSDNPLRMRRPPSGLIQAPLRQVAPPPKINEESEPEDNTEWVSYTLTTTKRALLADNRYHIMRLHGKYVEVPDQNDPTGRRCIMVPETIKINDPEVFKQPIRLHRHDTLGPPGDRNKAEPVDEEERKRQEFKAEKIRIRAELISKVAPDGGGRNNFRTKNQKKTQQVQQSNAAQVANRKMRYEEEYPWVVRDADDKQIWQAQREHLLSNGNFVILYPDHERGSFRMVPVEKWYRFSKVNRGRKLTEEEIKAGEKKIGKQPAPPSWVNKAPKEFVETEKLTREEEELYIKNRKLRVTGVRTAVGVSEDMKGTEELDFNDEELFDNDDAGGILGEFGNGPEGEEAAKDAAKRIREEQLSANVFASRTQKDYDDEKRKLRSRKFVLKDHGKKVSKALKRREGNYTYDSDDEDPHIGKVLSGSDKDSDTDSEAEAEEFKKWNLEQKKVAVKKEAEEASKAGVKAEAVKRATEKRKAKEQTDMRESSAAEAPAIILHSVSNLAGNESKSRKRSRSPESQEPSKKRKRGGLAPGSSEPPFTSAIPSPSPVMSSKKRPRSPEPENLIKPSGLLKRRRVNNTATGNTQLAPEDKSEKNASPRVSKSSFLCASKCHQLISYAKLILEDTSTSLLISDEEIIAALRVDAQGAAIKDLANTFKSRLKGGSNDVQVLAQRLKQFGTKEGNTKRWKLKKEFL